MKIFNKNEWKKVKLGDICEVITGNTPLKKIEEYWNKDEVPFITPPELKYEGINYITPNVYVSKIGAKQGRIIPKNSICVCCIGSLGKLGILKEDAITNQQINSLTLKDKNVDLLYLYFYLKTIKNNLESIASSTTVKIINKSSFEKIEINLPSLEIQKKLSKKLELLENNIQLRKSQLVFLKELTKSLFTTMFGDIKTNDKNWKLFEIKEISNIITRGKTPKYALSSNIFVINQACIYWDKIKYENMKFHIEDESLLFLKNKDVLINSTGTGTLGRMNIIQNIIHEKFTIDSHVMLVRLKDEKTLPLYFINIFMNEKYQKDLLLKCVNGSTNQIELSKEKFSKFKIPVPPIELQNKFAKRIEKIAKLSFEIEEAIKEAENLYNSLMSKYFD